MAQARGRCSIGAALIRREPLLDRRRFANATCDLDFWGPVSNFGIPVAAVMDTQKSPDL